MNMRPLSMTGFGSGEKSLNSHSWSVSVKTVNHRFLDIRIKLPHAFQGLEEKIRQQVTTLHNRGRVEVGIDIHGDSSDDSVMTVNMNLARQYFNCLQEIQQEFNIDKSPQLADIISKNDVITRQDQVPNLDEEWPPIKTALTDALATCLHMREHEGNSLQKDLLNRLLMFQETLDFIEKQIPGIISKRREDLKKRLKALQDSIDIDPQRLNQEMAILIDKSDVTEEIVRLHSHIKQFETFLHMDEPVGRRLDFLLQEFLREVNTLASKINNSDVAHKTVYLKSEIEKIREQVQNIE